MARAAERRPAAPLEDAAGLARSALDARGTLDPAAAVDLLRPLPAAVAAAREAGAPQQAPRKLGPEERALLSALGLVRPPRGVTAGPAPFHAPELAPGGTPTPQSDAYAVAGLLRTAITGEPPPPWTLDTLPRAGGSRRLRGPLDDLLWDALADDPAQRPADSATLLDRAAAAVAPGPAPPAREHEARPAALPAELREPKALVVIGATAAAFLVGAVLAVSGGAEDPAPPKPVAALPEIPRQTTGQLAYAAGMRDAMRGLNTRRGARREQLAAAGTTAGQARAATALGDAYGIAARSVERTPTPPQAQDSTAGIARTMLGVESAYREMARGARDGDRPRYVRGRDAVRRREAALQRRIDRLERLGYDVV